MGRWGLGLSGGVRGSRAPISAENAAGVAQGKGKGLGVAIKRGAEQGGREAGVWARVVDGTSSEVTASTGSKAGWGHRIRMGNRSGFTVST